ncbi:MAG: O-antigen ligase family protein [Chloroflexi bacterium]|nr:O-antigen ligase family protein [Chloroflexota bacterium]
MRLRWTIAARPFEPLFREYTDLFLYASDLFLIATLFFWLAALALAPRALTIQPRAQTFLVAVFTIVAVIGISSSIDAPITIYHAARLALLAVLYFFVVNEIRSFSFFALPLAIQVAMQSVIAFAQVILQHSIGWQSIGELALDPAQSGISIVLTDGARILRAYGLTDHPNILGGGLAFGLLALATIFLNEQSRRARAGLGAICTLGCAALFFTFSRAAWLAFGIANIFYFGFLLITRQKNSARTLGMLWAIALLFIAPLIIYNARSVSARLNGDNSLAEIWTEARSLAERATINRAVIDTILNSKLPFWGVGVGALPRAVMENNPQLDSYFQPAHIALLNAFAETGWLGGSLYAALLAAPFILLWRTRARIIFSPTLCGASALLIAIMIVGLFDYYTWLLAPGRLWQWIAWGVWAFIYRDAMLIRMEN